MADFELPRTWREAVPYIVWGVLILGFGLEFTTNLVHSNWLSAIISFCAMAGLAAMALHWSQLRSWAATISPDWVVGAFALLLLALIATPFVEQHRWPFMAWFSSPAAPTADEIAKAVVRAMGAEPNTTALQTPIAPSTDHQETFLSAGPPFAGKAVVGGPYLQEEINKMIQAVGSLSDIMHLDIKPTFDAAKSSIQNWDQQVQSEGVPAFAQKLSLSANKLTSSSKRIDDILSANARYDSEIKLTVHDRDPGPFVRELVFFSVDISATVDLPSQTREAVLNSDLERLRQAIVTYDNWIYAAADNADYKIQSLRAYRPPGSK